MAIVSDSNYFNLTKKTLTEKWSRCRQPLAINEDDLKSAIELFTKIAVEAIDESGSVYDLESHRISRSREIFLETASSSETLNKIKAFVEDKAYVFKRVCQTGFPFSLLDKFNAKIALKRALTHCDSILSHFMTLQDGWIDEKELDRVCGDPFQRLQTSEIAEACSDLKRTYLTNKVKKAGYDLLWLIKQATGCVYEIPEKKAFNDATVAKVLSDFFASSGSLKNGANFVEILHFRSSRIDKFLYQHFLDPNLWPTFQNFTVQQLAKTSMDNWPNKAGIITDLLETVNFDNKLCVVDALAASNDARTSEVGKHLSGALKAGSLTEAITHFNALTNLLPNFDYTHAEIIFGRPFIEFCHDRSIYKKDPEFTKRLRFNEMRKVFIHGPLMMGVHDTGTTYGAKRIPPHLLAYDMNTEKMVWGIPLTPASQQDPSKTSAPPLTFGIPRIDPARYILKKVGDLISLQFAGEKYLHFIHPETGQFDFTLELPQQSTDKYDSIHISPKGFGYQVVNKNGESVLIGGKIIDKRWHHSFEAITPKGLFRAFSTHFGFQQIFEDKLVLFAITGEQVTIEGCMAAEARNDKLYSIEKDPHDKDKCLLTVKTLKNDNEVVSSVEKSISLNVKQASFGEISQNGQLVLFSVNGLDTSPIFVDLHSQEATYSQHKFPSNATHLVNPDSGELWIWDTVSKKIWKVSSNSTTLMGSMESGRGTTLLHADKAGRLYFVNIPFY